MKRSMRTPIRLAIPIALAAIALAGCGDDSGTTTTTASQATAGGGAGGKAAIAIKMGEFYFSPSDATAKAGPTTIEAPNEGAAEHEMVLFKTNMDPAKLPTEANGEVNEEKMDKVAESAGEIADVKAGETKSGEFKLTPGKYVMFCNLPGHYAQGMYGTLTVTG